MSYMSNTQGGFQKEVKEEVDKVVRELDELLLEKKKLEDKLIESIESEK